jgi:general stress protein YciG
MNFFKERRGFAAMSEDKQRAISSKGGKAAHVKGTAHQFSAEEARRAGRLGGEAVSQNREHMALIGARGGQIRGQNALQRQQSAGSGQATSASSGSFTGGGSVILEQTPPQGNPILPSSVQA